MEANKENVHRAASTKIPLPLDPLPALPKRLLLKNNKEGQVPRPPLKTIQLDTARPGPSNNGKVKPKNQTKVDTRHVTLRRRNEDLDWNYKVFKENKDSVIEISDDENPLKVQQAAVLYHAENVPRPCLRELVAVTPSVKSPCLESSRVRNIKKSLRRPHSRELQGLSPLAKQQKKCDEKVKRRLHFSEHLAASVSSDHWKNAYMACITRDYSADIFNYLLSFEKKPLDVPKMSGNTRACIINWLMKVNGVDGNPAVIQTACWYLDSVLGTCHVETNKLQVVATACYWIAQKLHGCGVPASRLVKYSDKAFSAQRLVAAEKAVTLKLKFPHQPVIPQDFIPYLSWWCDENDSSDIEIGATFLCMSGLVVDKGLSDEYPSVIAAASVRNALLLTRKNYMMTHLQMCPLYEAIEKKALNISHTCALLRRAVRTLAAPLYEYKAALALYSLPPKYIAHSIVKAANEFTLIDSRNIRD